MDYTIITCECGNTYSMDVWEGECWVCGKEGNSPQNLPKADTYSLLADVREIAETCTAGLDCNYMDYQIGKELLTAMMVIKKKISEHFS